MQVRSEAAIRSNSAFPVFPPPPPPGETRIELVSRPRDEPGLNSSSLSVVQSLVECSHVWFSPPPPPSSSTMAAIKDSIKIPLCLYFLTQLIWGCTSTRRLRPIDLSTFNLAGSRVDSQKILPEFDCSHGADHSERCAAKRGIKHRETMWWKEKWPRCISCLSFISSRCSFESATQRDSKASSVSSSGG